MKSPASFSMKLRNLFGSSCVQMLYFGKLFSNLMCCLYRFFITRLNTFWVQLCYFVSLSFLGFLALKVMKVKTDTFRPKDIDMFFMSVSSVTVSSMSTVEMEVFSNSQLIFMTILMLVGGEVFFSMLEIHFQSSKFRKFGNKVDVNVDLIELGLVSVKNVQTDGRPSSLEKGEIPSKYKSLKYLGYIVLWYLLVVHVGGYIMVIVYISLVPSASDVLNNKGLDLHTFSVFTAVSTFSSCGFVPTNENMIIFRNNPGLLLILIPQVLLGNTLYPSCLRFIIWILERLTRRDEFEFMLKHTKEMEFHHLLPSLHSLLLVFTVLGFILVQLILFCCMEWNSGALDGMTSYEKLVGVLFQAVNARHTGESIVDLSVISPALLVLFGVMMYLPPYTSFLPIKENGQCNSNTSLEKRTKRTGLVQNLLFSQMSCLVLSIILICITEREKMKDDPLNFSLLNIAIEVVSAYGNVGFTTGYSCKRQINPNIQCKDTWYGFSGRWSNEGKLILILVMFFGRLKKFSMGKGKAWKLL